MMYGGNAHTNTGAYGPECKYMFPCDSDPCNWGTNGLLPNGPMLWTEETAGNQTYDRKMLSSAGPFTLEAGGVNYITIGIPWARAVTGGPQASVDLLKYYDDKIQRLFDICFRVNDGPDAPDISIRELDREFILYLTNRSAPMSNNYNEGFSQVDPLIIHRAPFTYDSLYRFEGYMIYQLKNPDVALNELNDPDKARLVGQCDVKNNVTRLVNYYYDPQLNSNIAVEEVNGANQGIVHSFRIVEDKFAQGNETRLVNNKKYYFVTIAYAFNEYEKFSDDTAIQFPGDISFYGQRAPFLMGRRNYRVSTAIPHIPTPLSDGTVQNSVYGTQPVITRVEGHGNGGLIVDLSDESIEQILEFGKSERITYKQNFSPVHIKVIDPLNIKPYTCRLFLLPQLGVTYSWELLALDENNIESEFLSEKTIDYGNEQLIFQLGLSIEIQQGLPPGVLQHLTNGLLFSDISYADNATPWLQGVADIDWHPLFNWIRSGTLEYPNNNHLNDYYYIDFIDPDEHYEKILGGTWAPYKLVSRFENGPGFQSSLIQSASKIENVYSVDVVLTPDKSKWSRCPVIETGDDESLAVGNVMKGYIRTAPSVDQDGNPDGTDTGMGWFPGYAINVETGERLNVMFGESSWLSGENGNDMLFNPTSSIETSLGEPLMGGKHFLYVFGNFQTESDDMSPAYDGGEWAKNKLTAADNQSLHNLYTSIMWVSIPLSVQGIQWLQSEAKVRIRVSRPYMRYFSTSLSGSVQPENDNYPLYEFSTHDLVASVNSLPVAQSALQLINIVPNPYYAPGDYENSQDQPIVKITNLPRECTISIFNAGGTLVKQFRKNDAVPWVEWDLKNDNRKRITGGMYIVHINAPSLGDRTLKWVGTMPQTSSEAN